MLQIPVLLLVLFPIVFLWVSTQPSLNKEYYLQFPSHEEVIVKEPTSFATLKSGAVGVLSGSSFTICGSIYVGYFRSRQAFYTVRREDLTTLWFSLNFYLQDLDRQTYAVSFNYFDGMDISNAKVDLKPHAWSHACTALNGESGQVTVVVNGVLTHNATLTMQNFLSSGKISLSKRLILGMAQYKMPGSSNINEQSEAPVNNINVFSTIMDTAEMIDASSSGQIPEGNHLSWKNAEWNLVGDVEIKDSSSCGSNCTWFPNLYLFSNFPRWQDCMNFCPKLQISGRVPKVETLAKSRLLSKQFKYMFNHTVYLEDSQELQIWSPFY